MFNEKNKNTIELQFKSNLFDYVMDKEPEIDYTPTTYRVNSDGRPKKFSNFGDYIFAHRYKKTFHNKVTKA